MNKKLFGVFIIICGFLSVAQARAPRVLIGSCVSASPEILEVFLSSLERLDSKGLVIDNFFVDHNSCPESKKLLSDFSQSHKGTQILNSNAIDLSNRWKTTEFSTDQYELLIWTLAAQKDQILKFAKEKNYDFVLLIDTNVILHPKSLKQLISTKKEIVSNIFWHNEELPQVWLRDVETRFDVKPGENISDEEAQSRAEAFAARLKIPGTYEVGGLGACTLIHKSALKKGACFERMTNLSYPTEDSHFCIRAAAIGIPLFVDTHYPAYLISNLSKVEGAKEFLSKCKL